METWIFALELMIFATILWRYGFALVPHGVLAYLMLSQLTVVLYNSGAIQYNFVYTLSLSGIYTFRGEVFTMYFYIFLTYAASALLLKSGRTSFIAPDFQLDARAMQILQRIALFCLLLAVVHAASLNWGIAWLHGQYLLLASDRALLSTDPVTSTLHTSSLLVGALTFVLLGFAVARRLPRMIWVILPAAFWFLSFQLAGHSRTSAFYLVVFVGVLMLTSHKPRYGLLVVGVAGILFAYVASLAGRSGGAHGFATLPDNLGLVTDFVLNRNVANTMSNMFEGVFSVAQGMVLGESSHSFPYKVLSFSPFPSAIDGFPIDDQIRIHRFIPMNAISEIVAFGGPFVVVYFAIQLWSIRLVSRLAATRPGIWPVACNAILLIGFIMQFSYPVRTALKPVYLVLGVILALAVIEMIRQSREQTKQKYLPYQIAGNRP